MNASLELIREVLLGVLELPSSFSAWATSMDDQTFLRVMVVGLALLTAVVMKSLR